jgi:hypothetical protein
MEIAGLKSIKLLLQIVVCWKPVREQMGRRDPFIFFSDVLLGNHPKAANENHLKSGQRAD